MAKKVLLDKLAGLYVGEQATMMGSMLSGIAHKQACLSLQVGCEHVAGDTQADRKYHGGQDRVLHHFPREHYGQYRRWDMMAGSKDVPAMGENISSVGLDESQVHIGDIMAIGGVTVQVTQGRSPCFKLNKQFGHPQFALKMQTSGLCGWFYRVLTPGVIHLDDSVHLLQRCTDMSVRESMNIYFATEFDAAAYTRLASCEGLATAWVNSLQQRLETQKIEPWKMRLIGPE